MADITRQHVGPATTGPAWPAPQHGPSVEAPAVVGQPKPRTPSAAATIPTATTLLATPNPVPYPGQMHLVATVSPAPVPSNGFQPGVGFYLNGNINASAALDASGVGSVDLSLPPGTYLVKAGFGGLGDYEASESAETSVVVVQSPPLAAVGGSAALQASAGFPGDAASRQVQAANPSLGVGPTDIVQMSEDGARFFDRSGDALFHIGLPDYFLFEPNGQANDPHQPRVHFDAIHGRWLATEVTHDFGSGNGHVYLEISDTSSAIDGFWVYRFDFANEAPSNPAIGVTGDKVAIGFDVDVLNSGTFKGSTVMVLSIADLIAHKPTVFYQRTAPSTSQRTWRPAAGLSAGNTLHAVGSGPASTPAHILYLTATGTVTGPGTGITFTMTDLTGGSTALPDVGAPGPVLGPTNALWSNNHLWFVATRTCFPTGDTFSQLCVRVTELATSPALAVMQDFVIGTKDNANFGGGIGLAGDGSLTIVYSQAFGGPSSGPVPISTLATTQVPGDPVNSVRPSQLIDQGTAWCPGGPTCGGGGGGSATYLAVPTDPADSHTVWEGAVTSVEGGWRTWIARLRTATGAPTGTFTLAGGRPATNSLRLGIGLTAAASAAATQVLVSNSPIMASGKLGAAVQVPIGWRMPWSLANPATGGSAATGTRTVYLQWGDGRGTWSTVMTASIKVDTPLGADLVPVDPVRLLDTRFGNGLTGRFSSGVARSFQVTGRGGIPTGAVAVTGNLTVTGQTSSGYVFLGPTAPNNPTSSTLNVPLGDTRANGVTVKLSATGRLGAVFVGRSAGRTTNLIFDVTGYLIADNPTTPVGSTWVPIDPVRALDTRVPIGLQGKFFSKVPRTFCITGCVPVPDDAIAVTGNLTVTGQSTAGYVFLGPVATSVPTSSTLNFPVGDNRANNVTVRLDDNGNLSAVFVGSGSTASTHLIFDISGYFVPGPWGATFIPLNPARTLDTRFGVGLSEPFFSGIPRSFAMAGHGGVPATGTLGVTGNLTITEQSTAGYAFVGPAATSTPTSSTINVPASDTRANGIDVGLAANGTLSGVWVGRYASSGTSFIFDVGGYFR